MRVRSTAAAAASALIALAACRRDRPPARDRRRPAPAPAQAPAPPPDPFIRAPDPFVRDIAESEAAAERAHAEVGKALCRALVREDRAAAAALLLPAFAGRFVAEAAADAAPGEAAIGARSRPPAADALGRDALLDRLWALRASFASVERCTLKPFRFRLAEPGRDRAAADLSFEIAGRGPRGRPRLARAQVAAELGREGDAWRLVRAAFGPVQEVEGVAPAFADVTAAVGAGLPRAPDTTHALQARSDTRTVTTIGGVGVIDHDRDGFDDLLVWIAGREVALLRNDGRGAFERAGPLIPAADTGLFHLWLDLDGDGAEEIVSSAVTGCRDGRARLGLYTRRGGGYQAVPPPAGLEFSTPCAGWRRLRFEHVAVADLTGDGILDLYLSGFSRLRSREGGVNLYRASDGQRDLLFVGGPGLRFSEEAEARGVRDASYTYVAELFDFDEDGDTDIYAVNDYGPNDLWVNDGGGRFSAAPPGPLTGNANSMGVTVADVDGDLHLDVYVSNMYSSAGNRVIPLVQGQVSQETFRTLLAMAAGNALFARVAPGRYADRAADLGVQNAQWAWGHAVFDFDHDGDRDIWVANGLNSHSDAAAPDF